MNDRELADRIVALGVIGKSTDGWILFVGDGGFEHCDEPWNDWRVVGALMEHFPKMEYQWGDDYDCVYVSFEGDDLGHLAICIDTDSLPRAICEACVKALQLERGDIV